MTYIHEALLLTSQADLHALLTLAEGVRSLFAEGWAAFEELVYPATPLTAAAIVVLTPVVVHLWREDTRYQKAQQSQQSKEQ